VFLPAGFVQSVGTGADGLGHRLPFFSEPILEVLIQREWFGLVMGSRPKDAKQNQTISRRTKGNQTGTKNETPYSAWLQTEILHTLQQTVSDHPGEYAFLVNAQVQELYWALIVKEMQAAQVCLREDNLVAAHRALLRVVDHYEPLNATWQSLSWITPSDLMPILAAVRATYGRDTALQGWTYRNMVYLLGIKQEQHLKHLELQPHRFAQLQKVLNEPSLYDDVLAFLSRRGFRIPAEVLRRDPSKTYVPDPEVEKVWATAYETDPPVKMLGETMADIAEEFTTWKYRHLMATRRTIGNRSAYFGTPAVSWLLPTLEEIPFPELFSARTLIGDQPQACPYVKS
jgi:tryptophan 2,3-dioxygenase